MKSSPRPVLVLDADQPSALAIVRSLGRLGLPVHVAASADKPLAGWSRHASLTLRYPDPLRHEHDFAAWLRSCIEQDVYGLVIPVTERTVVPAMRHRASFDDRPVAMASTQALEQVLHKDRTIALAQALGVPVPRSIKVTSMSQLPDIAASIPFPIVVKPSRSVGQDGQQRVQLSVGYAYGARDLEDQLRQALRYGEVVVQEYFRGDGVGIELIADKGAVRYAFQHRRLHEVPLTGGGSSLRISEALAPPLLKASEQLIAALQWHGVAMVEFKYAPQTGEFRLIEINGRFWGSLPLAIAAGADFPRMLHELWTTGSVGEHAAARTGVVCRQLARDIDWLEHVLRRASTSPLVALPGWRDIARDSLLTFSPRHNFDVQSLRDPVPGLVDLGRIIAHQGRRLVGAYAQRRRLGRERAAVGPDGPGRQRAARAGRVLFLCYGNINRSALAQAVAEARHGGKVEFHSAGFHGEGGRPADPIMVDVARSQGVDMAGWRSHVVDREMIDRADVILAMETAHLDRLYREHPVARGKAFLLGAPIAAGRHDVEIVDPYGKSLQVYQAVCQQVSKAVDTWFGTKDGA